MRYIARKKISFSKLLLMSGGIPNELTSEDFKYLGDQSEVYYVYDTKEIYKADIILKVRKK